MPDGRVLATTVTDGVGRYVLAGLPVGWVTLVFRLEGFDTSRAELTIERDTESRVVQRLGLAQITEQVVVYGKAPAPPPPPPPSAPAPRPPPPIYPRFLPPPRPTVIPVPAEELESVCGPAMPRALAESFGTIQSHRYDYGRMLYGKGDELVVNGGTANGIAVGQNLVVRRNFRANSPAADVPEMGEHSSGLVQIVSAAERSSTAIVVYACTELMQGDLLMAFRPEPVRTPFAVGTPAYDEAARILFAEPGQLLGAPWRLMVIDRGSDQGLRAGQRLTLFRRAKDTAPRVLLGEAVVVSLRGQSATIRVQTTTDAIEFGDWAAPQR
jgi:hypothetical protein